MPATKYSSPFLWIASLSLLWASCAGDPEAARLKYLASGDQFLKQGKYGEAVVQYGNALKRNPRSGDTRLKIAEAYMAAGNTRAAFPEYVRAADLLPEDANAQNKAGRLLVNGGFFEE